MLYDEAKLLKFATHAAEDAGKALLRLFCSSKLFVRRKHDYPGSIVTNADRISERIILAWIKRSKIRSTVVSEESGTLGFGSSDVVWAVDPLDGTLNYSKRIPHFAVSIGALIKRKPVLGAVYNPFLDEMFTVKRGEKARLNGKPIHVSNRRFLRGSSLIFEWWNTEPSIPDPLRLEKDICRLTRNVRSPGSVALNLCSVASGRFDGLITVFRKSPIYETAAGCLMVHEAGGRVTDSSGESWESFSRSILAGGPHVHRQILSLVRRKNPVST